MTKKIAILGGGVSAMTAAVYLTSKHNWQQDYEITVYQMGWRLGGKGASGRNAQFGQRIEEHGLHVWFGAYVNSFRTMQYVYNELARPSSVALATWQDAFKPHSYVVLQEQIDKQWKTWPITFPLIDGNPADGTLDLHFWQILRLLHAWLKQFIEQLQSHESARSVNHQLQTKKVRDRSLLKHLVGEVKAHIDELEEDVGHFFDAILDDVKEIWSNPTGLVTQLANLLEVRANDKQFDKKDLLVVWYLVRKVRRWMKAELMEELTDNDEIRRLYICADLAITVTIGLVRDKVYSRGFGALNQYDFKEWLVRHGADQTYSVNSAPIRGFYDLVFGYENGDFAKPNIEAGVSLLAMIRIMLCYQGGVMWKMQGGMGDVIFAPIYELLEKRGVKFEFFHEVTNLSCRKNQSGQWQVSEIEILKQAHLKGERYLPLVTVGNLPCWPSEPDYSQLTPKTAAFLKSNDINLESFWSGYEEAYRNQFGDEPPTFTLKQGVDFDDVIFGISVASIPHLCGALLEVDAALAKQVQEVKAVATQAFQLWLTKTDEELGFSPAPEHPILSGFSQPFDTWAGMANLIDKEQWETTRKPSNIAYFCSALPVDRYPPKSDREFPNLMKKRVKQNWKLKLEKEMQTLWPKAYLEQQFDASVLFALNDNVFDAQYWRANIDPSERYVLSLKGSSKYRLKTDQTQFNNLYITGDWIATGVNAGCVEAAVMAGMQTARAVANLELVISGEHGFEPFVKVITNR